MTTNSSLCIESPAGDPEHWILDRSVDFLNHGSFGACPRPVLEAQSRYREEMEREPVRFMTARRGPLQDEARQALCDFLGSRFEDIVPVPNSTSAVSAVVRSLDFEPGDELLTTNHAYNACTNALRYVAERCGAQLRVAEVPFPLSDAEQVVEAVLGALTDRTRLVMLDHVTSPTALIFPIDRLVSEIQGRGIDVLVDGSHAPAMVPLDLDALGAAYYTGNCHKWMCAPKGAGFLHVRRDRQEPIVPAVISHGMNMRRPGRSRFHDLFDWIGTIDPTPWICVKDSIEFLESAFPGGAAGLAARNRRLALAARDLLCRALSGDPPAPNSMLGTMATVVLPDESQPDQMDFTTSPSPSLPLYCHLLREHNIDVPVSPWPAPPRQTLRISAQAYNHLAQFERLAEILKQQFTRTS
ncbi:aminotransferase class V-fold PLP-dependent enzyme [Haloferula sp. A504]|uniref:aminotransferase class V-fold PLP-dependent enzyme n=1 Tax=Haloferula sp. A504 TaxID=3373601 RepID=UPI0031CC29B5|nr:aminotransferase class V-fold PLP-dependent enzyme [Verrucomicrobiaceae bacterium E54]